MATQLPLPIGLEDWKTWATRLVQALGSLLAPLQASQTGQLSEFRSNNIPSGWLITDGSGFDGKSFPALKQVLNSTTLPNIASAHAGFTMAIKT